jgi:spore germination cell wall hydrolase CwlJ-like protein
MIDSVGRAHRRADCAVLGALALAAVSGVSAQEFNQYTYEQHLLKHLPASVEVTPSPLVSVRAQRAAEAECLAQVMYYEARGEGVQGQKAVAEVVLQRTKSRDYPETVCGVVYEGTQPGRRDCQFSFACDGTLRRPRDRGAWSRVRVLAERIMAGDVKLSGVTHNATAYHSIDIAPAWAEGMIKTAEIGNHVFYKRDPFAQARLVEAIVVPSIRTISGLFSQDTIAPLEVAVPSENIKPAVEIPAVLLRDGA